MKKSCLIAIAFATFLCAPLFAFETRLSLSDQDIDESSAFGIDAQCSAAFQIMVDLGTERGADTVSDWTKRASFLAAQAIIGHTAQRGTTTQEATAIVKDLVVQKHGEYVEGMQSTNTKGATQEFERFVQDMKFCNLRLLALDTILGG